MVPGLHARLGTLLALVVCAGCFTTPPLHPARPLKKGDLQLALATSAYGWEDPEDNESERWANIEFQARKGLGDRVDAGFKTNLLSGLGLDVNCALLLDDDTALSIDPTFELPYYESTLVWLPVLWDCHHTDTCTLTVSAFGGYFHSYMSEDEEDDLFSDLFLAGDVGGSARLYGAGISALLGPADKGRFAPDLRVVLVDDPGQDVLPVYMLSLGYLF